MPCTSAARACNPTTNGTAASNDARVAAPGRPEASSGESCDCMEDSLLCLRRMTRVMWVRLCEQRRRVVERWINADGSDLPFEGLGLLTGELDGSVPPGREHRARFAEIQARDVRVGGKRYARQAEEISNSVVPGIAALGHGVLAALHDR